MPKFKITAPRSLGKIPEGTSFTVISRTTSSTPDASDIEDVLISNGYSDTSSLSYRASGNWKIAEIEHETDHVGWQAQHASAEKTNNNKKTVSENNNSILGRSSSSDSLSKDSSDCGSCQKTIAQVVFTIIPILPIWWICKLLINGVSYCIKSVFYIISWPFRLLLCCCCNTDFLPEGSMPSYWFDWE